MKSTINLNRRVLPTWLRLVLIIAMLMLMGCRTMDTGVATPLADDSLPPQAPPEAGPETGSETGTEAGTEPQSETVVPQATRSIYLPIVATIQPGPRYFFDSVNGSDANSGTSPTSPWQSLTKLNAVNYEPGTTIYLRRGSSWTGSWVIDNSGTPQAPITFTAYGNTELPLPVFRNPGSISNLTNAVKIRADYVILEFVRVQEAQLSGVYIDTGADHNIVRYIEATLTGEGINVHGQYNRVLFNHIHDLTMVRNTPGGDDDYGAVGVWLFNHYNEVAYNRIINCRAPSYDYGEDGGAVEFYRDVNGSYIHHNYSFNTKGFTEIGGGTAYDNVIAYNMMVNSGRPLGLHLSGGFASDIRGLYFENNTVVDTTPEGFAAAILFLGAPATPEMLIMRNNIFYLENFDKLATSYSFVHEHNIYYLPNGSNSFELGPGEVRGDPLFVDVYGGDYHLLDSSPAIDSGTDLGYAYDYEGNPVPTGGTPDMGIFEFQFGQ